ncbi:HAMP domain-containing sensor histidine kinase [Anaerocolumna sp. AGMB13025]|uniref:sensor histidine kinase n=1 Tax=Anaerocolumna sp. AGMB13025 TaxID=3039116 RepID=UPI00241D74DA|nr:HAMP domain-containing sensor histidine kinase [Anaerocolumna sp. AGMB13025]WFR57398.1 HAMP domain-containing sensor histidine kinase [Anaerocolumna sp. AGMB13025]
MKLKSRLLTAFLIITALPIFLITIAVGTIARYQANSIEQTYDVKSDTIKLISNPLQILSRLTRGVYNEIVITAVHSPEKFEDEKYINYLNNELKGKYSYIVLRKGDNFIYSGDEEKLDNNKSYFPRYGEYKTDMEGGFYVDGKNPFLLKQQDFHFTDGTEGSIFVVTDVDTLVPQIKASAIQLACSLVFVVMLTAGVLIIWIYRSILRPLNTLHAATDAMKEGNLDYSIEGDPEDEIGQLCVDFEEMRIRLKELIEVRLKYEEDTKELISNISHDLKTPITAIKGYAEGIMDGVADTQEKQAKYIKTIYTKANDMSALVDELSFYSKIDCNTMPYTFANINLHDYFSDCIEELNLDLEVKNIEFIYENQTDHGLKVSADAEQLKRVINNIIGNSVKYIGSKKGLIKIQIKDIGEYVQISIEDSGQGIAEKDLPFIFDRFYRADASRNSTKGGTGLGLAIVKKIIQDHMGTIWAESEEGKGTTIYFTLKKSKEVI